MNLVIILTLMASFIETISEKLLNSMARIKQYIKSQPIKDNSKYRLAYYQAVDPGTLIGYFNDTIYLYNYHTSILQLLDSTHRLIKTIDLNAGHRRIVSNYNKEFTLTPISMTVDNMSIIVKNQNYYEVISYVNDLFAVIPYTNGSYRPTHDIELKHGIYTITATGYVLTVSTDRLIYQYTSVTKVEIPLYCKKVQVIDDTVYYLNNNYEFVVYSLKTHEPVYTLPIVYDYCIVGSNIYFTANSTMQMLTLL